MMKVSMTKLYDMYIKLLGEKANGATTVTGVFSKLGINMVDYWQHEEYKDLVIEENFKEKQIKIKLPYTTRNNGKYISEEIINRYYKPSVYFQGYCLQKRVFHNIEIKVNIQQREYVIDLDKLLCEIKEELRLKKITAQNEYEGYCEKIKDLEKKKNRVCNKLTYCSDFEDDFDKIVRLY